MERTGLMAKQRKLCVIGGASTYTPELIEGFIERQAELGLATVALMDIDEDRLRVVGGLARRMIRAAGSPLELVLATEREKGLEGADFVICQIRVGGSDQRVIDEKIALRFDIVGQETTGPGGFAKALRTIPVMLSLAADMERLCPHAWLINFTNPSGLVTEALVKHSKARAIGLCNLPINMLHTVAGYLGVEPPSISLDYVGLNHLSWVKGAYWNGQDVTEIMMAKAVEEARQVAKGHSVFSAELLEELAMLPCYYLRYYYHHDKVLQEQREAGKTRGEEVREIEETLLAMYGDPRLDRKPEELEKRGGALYSTAAVSLVAAIVDNRNEVHIVNCQNRGAIADLPLGSVVEVPCLVGTAGAAPLMVGRLPVAIRGLIQSVKAYEELTVEAAVTGDRRSALQALLNHPLVPSYGVARGLLGAILEANRDYLPQFFS
jgi:6-phospho-beta-glucosidase